MNTGLRVASLAVIASALVLPGSASGRQSQPPSKPTVSSADQATGAPPQPGRVQGLVSDVTGSCTTVLNLKIDGKPVRIEASTKFEQGACADLTNGNRGGAIGKLVEGVIIAERAIAGTASAAPGQPPGPPPGSAMTILQGIVGNVAGSCPTLTFTLDGKPVQVEATARFEAGTCADVKNGIKVAAGGRVQANGGIIAIGVRIGGMPPTPMPTVIGILKARRGTCPAISFTVDTMTVETNDKTIFSGRTCEGLAEGIQVAIAGVAQLGSQMLVARQVISRK